MNIERCPKEDEYICDEIDCEEKGDIYVQGYDLCFCRDCCLNFIDDLKRVLGGG